MDSTLYLGVRGPTIRIPRHTSIPVENYAILNEKLGFTNVRRIYPGLCLIKVDKFVEMKKMSTHEARVIKVDNLEKHPNSDRLAMVQVGGYTTCVRSEDFAIGDQAVFIEPDTLVPVANPIFAFMADKAKDGYARIKAMRLRGIQSFGLLVHAPSGVMVGDDVWEMMRLVHYDPPERGGGGSVISGDTASPPSVPHVRYDMESLRKYNTAIQEGTMVEVSEKIHGCSSRYVWHDGQLHVGSHNRWVKEDDRRSTWWQIATQYNLDKKLSNYPDSVFYGVIYGAVQDLHYGVPDGEVRWAIFDIMWKGEWLAPYEVRAICDELDLPQVPELYRGRWNADARALVDGPSTIPGANHIREGIVVKPLEPRTERYGRVIGKLVSVDYLARKEK